MANFPIAPLRQAFLTLPEQVDQTGAQMLPIQYFYVPASHAKAIHPDNVLVSGMRGAGKSEWWLQLQDSEHRQLVADRLPRSELANVQCLTGFGLTRSENYPDKKVLSKLLEQFEAQTIWNAIIAWNVLGTERFGLAAASLWSERVAHYQKQFELLDRQLIAIDDQFSQVGQKQVVLFDALDRTADDWQALKQLLKGLLQVALEFRSFRALRLKIFVRPDMLADNTVFAFPDGSKLQNDQVSLEWSRLELFNLLWQYLGNAEQGGEVFRDGCGKQFGARWEKNEAAGVWIIPEAMRNDETLQRKIFHALAGEWMGTDARRGNPYTWLPNHLGDSKGMVSPRSFLAALREAATDGLVKEQKYALSYQTIKKGVQKASQIRVRELSEDYPWMEDLLKSLQNINVPCVFGAIAEVWDANHVIENLAVKDSMGVRLLPSRRELGCEGVKQDLVDLGIFDVMRDGRINMPDVYRVGYGLGRKGGVKPVR